jgi:hypothetical protein
MALEADFMLYRYRPTSTFPPVPAHLQASQAANNPHMPQPGPSGQGKSLFLTPKSAAAHLRF